MAWIIVNCFGWLATVLPLTARVRYRPTPPKVTCCAVRTKMTGTVPRSSICWQPWPLCFTTRARPTWPFRTNWQAINQWPTHYVMSGFPCGCSRRLWGSKQTANGWSNWQKFPRHSTWTGSNGLRFRKIAKSNRYSPVRLNPSHRWPRRWAGSLLATTACPLIQKPTTGTICQAPRNWIVCQKTCVPTGVVLDSAAQLPKPLPIAGGLINHRPLLAKLGNHG